MSSYSYLSPFCFVDLPPTCSCTNLSARNVWMALLEYRSRTKVLKTQADIMVYFCTLLKHRLDTLKRKRYMCTGMVCECVCVCIYICLCILYEYTMGNTHKHECTHTAHTLRISVPVTSIWKLPLFLMLPYYKKIFCKSESDQILEKFQIFLSRILLTSFI